MKFELYSDANKFKEETHNILNRHTLENNLFYININNALEGNTSVIMMTVKNDVGDIILTSIRTPPAPLLIYETDNIHNEKAVEFLAESMLENKIDVNIIMTEPKLALSFCEKYSKKADKKYFNSESMVLYAIEEKDMNDIKFAEGKFRAATLEKDMSYLPFWYGYFGPACNMGQFTLENGLKKAKLFLENGKTYIWEDENGQGVSVASISRKGELYGMIGTVYTPSWFEGKGYARSCVASLCKKIFADGFKYSILYADCDNPVSNKVYQNIGFKAISYYEQYKFIDRLTAKMY